MFTLGGRSKRSRDCSGTLGIGSGDDAACHADVVEDPEALSCRAESHRTSPPVSALVSVVTRAPAPRRTSAAIATSVIGHGGGQSSSVTLGSAGLASVFAVEPVKPTPTMSFRYRKAAHGMTLPTVRRCARRATVARREPSKRHRQAGGPTMQADPRHTPPGRAGLASVPLYT